MEKQDKDSRCGFEDLGSGKVQTNCCLLSIHNQCFNPSLTMSTHQLAHENSSRRFTNCLRMTLGTAVKTDPATLQHVSFRKTAFKRIHQGG